MKKKKSLSRAEMKNIVGGNNRLTCLPAGSSCGINLQCCSNKCVLRSFTGEHVCSG